jgi:XTP/dITP diphosphohydrolase
MAEEEEIVLTLASGNAHKALEIAAMLPAGVRMQTLKEIAWTKEIAETGRTFLENAGIKAHTVARETGRWVLADDSGLETEALQGAPGVYSARFAGERAGDADNLKLLLDNMQHHSNRKARFVAVLVLSNGIKDFVFEGICEGSITTEERGAGGFGYDPVFIPQGHAQSFAEMPTEEKNKISHRAMAMKAFVTWLVKHRHLLR